MKIKQTAQPMEGGDGKIKILNDLAVSINNETHTMMGPLRWAISNNWTGKRVDFCGYSIPHPSLCESHLTVQLADESEQSTEAVLAKLEEGLDCLDRIADKLLAELN